MDNTLRNGMAGGRGNSRRQFLRDVVTGGISVAVAAALPAGAQEKPGLAAVPNEPATSSATRTCRLRSYAR
jgi:hypothetical protein